MSFPGASPIQGYNLEKAPPPSLAAPKHHHQLPATAPTSHVAPPSLVCKLLYSSATCLHPRELPISWEHAPHSRSAHVHPLGGPMEQGQPKPTDRPLSAPLCHSTSVEALKSLLSTTGHWNDFAHLQLRGAWENFTCMHTYPKGVGLLARCGQGQAVCPAARAPRPS